jgi:predicted MFS family arabinose efflux permease
MEGAALDAGCRARLGYQQVFKVFTLFKHPGVTVGMLASSLLFMGQFGLFTYVRPFLETVTNVRGSTISLFLLVLGAAGFIGTVLIGRVLQRSFYQTLIVIPALMAATALALIAFGGSVAIVALLLALWGLTGTSAPVGWWAWIAKVFPKMPKRVEACLSPWCSYPSLWARPWAAFCSITAATAAPSSRAPCCWWFALP